MLAFVLFSEFTKAWLLYLGLVFLFMVMYAPGGIASLIMMNVRVAAFGRLRELWRHYLFLAISSVMVLLGAAAIVEMIYHLQLNAMMGSELPFAGVTLDVKSAGSWVGSAVVMAVVLGLFEMARRRFAVQWGAIQAFIEKELKRREGSA